MNENETNGKLEYLDQEIKKLEEKIRLMPELAFKLADMKAQKMELERESGLDII